MIFVATCLDGDNGPAIRSSDIRPQHLAFIEEAGSLVKMAGPILNDTGTPVGSLLIIEAEDEEAAHAFLAQDPYANAGLFQSVEVRMVKPLLGDWLV